MVTPFLGSESEHTRQQLRAKRFLHPSRNLYLVGPGTWDALDLPTRVLAARLVVPGSVACLWTAGLLTKLPVDDDGLVHLVRDRDETQSERDGISVHRFPVRDDEWFEYVVGDSQDLAPASRAALPRIPVTEGPRSLADLSAYLGFEALVAVGDVVLRRSSEEEVQEAVGRARGRPGVQLLRQVVPLLDGGSGSPAETRMRLRLHAAGFVGLVHGVKVRDALGEWVSAPDLADPEARVAVQHEGKVHFEKGEQQRIKDVDRDELTREQDYEVVISTRVDDRDPSRLVRRVTAAYRRAAGRWGNYVLPPHMR